ncbi:MAG: GNAT family N-acetyltransferase [Shimia sp.]
MTPAQIVAAAFPDGSHWTTADFDAARTDPAQILIETPESFALARVTLDEAELLLIGTHPSAQRTGAARLTLQMAETACRDKGACRMFLEVAADNIAAQALYRQAGYAVSGRRKGYYARPYGAVDALLMDKRL